MQVNISELGLVTQTGKVVWGMYIFLLNFFKLQHADVQLQRYPHKKCANNFLLALWFTFLPMGLYMCMRMYMHAFLLGSSEKLLCMTECLL